MPERVELISEIAALTRRLPGTVVSELTYPSIFRECPALVFPATLRITDAAGTARQVHVVNHADSAPFAQHLPYEERVEYGRYFEWNAPGGPGGGFADAVRRIAGQAEVLVAADLVLARYDALAASGPVRLAAPRARQDLHCYLKSRAEIEAQWDATRRDDNRRIAPFLKALRHGEQLRDAMERPAVGFGALDAAMAQAGLAGLLVTSAHNVELFTGLGHDTISDHGMSCLYRPGEADIMVFATRRIRRADLVPRGQADDLTDALAAGLPSGAALGVEEPSIPVGLAMALRAAGFETTGAIAVLRRWQEARAITDIGYFILAANAVLKGFAHARDWFGRARGATLPPRERDLEAIFQQGVADFAASLGFAGRVKPYFSIVHSGERTLLPATAGDYPARHSDDTIKFDMGVLVEDRFGTVRACSDIARTICRTIELQAAHDALQAALIDTLIPAMRPGMSGAEVHAAGIEALRGCEAALVAAGLLPEGVSFEGYSRDCGHSLHRTTTATLFFLPGVSARLVPGMLGCVEFVWPLGDRVLAVEDGYLVSETGVIPFTA